MGNTGTSSKEGPEKVVFDGEECVIPKINPFMKGQTYGGDESGRNILPACPTPHPKDGLG